MLNRIRSKIEPMMNTLGLKLASTGISPNAWTIIGFFISALSGIIYAMQSLIEYAIIYGGIILIISGFTDMIDGAVARATKQISRKGAFLDSTLDRVSEVIIYAGILYANISNSLFVLLAITLSLLVSYARARAESLGIELRGVGIGERAERLLILAITSILAGLVDMKIMDYGLIIIIIIAAITFIQRVIIIINKLS
ncbi:MAG: CDP-alcohol phosphatidyltransferase family protein [Candidatus Nitrosothermus koennekii]|nr:MAG: CDP-alcohol phosphatidyltransferase family protein [Candidatus Nitrosothermus koennekii]